MAKKKRNADGHMKISADGTTKRRRINGSTPAPPNLVERTNSLPLEELKARFIDTSLLSFVTGAPHVNGVPQSSSYNIELYMSSTLPDNVFSDCFDLLEANLSESYRATTKGWQPKKKKEEMKHPAMRYLILTSGSTTEPTSTDPEKIQPTFVGFLEFMVTEEEGSEVIYTYEIDIVPSYQGLGLGRKLLDVAEEFGKRVGVEKAMLTVFDSNRGARRFYEREGYEIDDISPEPKILRNGLVKQPTFHILSKVLNEKVARNNDDEDEVMEG
ncbi:hypothetical protein ABW19_dt0209155 [Dactylella cylindrospora]|nr:hypothetical protein ABW19_dt0209155 [Dactylella cylindrospora]